MPSPRCRRTQLGQLGTMWFTACSPGFLATLVFAAFGWHLSAPYIAKQAARAMCAFEGAQLLIR